MARATGTAAVVAKLGNMPMPELLGHYHRVAGIYLDQEQHTADGEYRCIFSLIGAIGLYLYGDEWREALRDLEME